MDVIDDAGVSPIVVDTGVVHAEILPQGAQLVRWRVHDDDVVWLSPLANRGRGTAIRGGVPICFPWFGSGPHGDLSPAHGLARLAIWRHLDTDDAGETVDVTFELAKDDLADLPGSDHWPEGLVARHCIRVGEMLHMELTATWQGQGPCTVEMAHHTYVRVSQAAYSRVEGVTGWSGVDTITGEPVTLDGPQPTGDRVDRILVGDGPVFVTDGSVVRRVDRDRSAQIVVWNPGPGLARNMADVPDDGWQEFVCVESANVREHAITLEPGESFTMTTQLRA